MVAWPGGLPTKPLEDGYQERFRTMGIRSTNDAGPAKQRRRFTAAVRTIQLTFKLTPAQVETLDAFWETGTGGGTLPFTWVHPRTQAAVTMRFIADQPPLVQPRNRGMFYTVSFSIEILP